MAKTKDKRKVERYKSTAALREAVRAWCIDQVGGESAARYLVQQVERIGDVAADSRGRDLSNRLSGVLHEARAYLRQIDLEDRRPVTFYSDAIRRIVDAISKAGAWPPMGAAQEVTPRRLLAITVDTPVRSKKSNRELAIWSLLGGNGNDWVIKQMRRAKESGVASKYPSVLDMVRAEERAIAEVRKRVTQATAMIQAKARELDRAIDPAERKKLQGELAALRFKKDRTRRPRIGVNAH